MIVLAPIAILALIVAVILVLFRPRSQAMPPMAHESIRSVAGLDAAEDAPIVDRVRKALRARGAEVSAIDHDYAVELEVRLAADAFAVTVGWVGDEDAPWKIFVDGRPEPSRDAVELVHALLVEIAGSATKVRWTTRALDAAGRPAWQPAPT